jgi:hypothetical protein
MVLVNCCACGCDDVVVAGTFVGDAGAVVAVAVAVVAVVAVVVVVADVARPRAYGFGGGIGGVLFVFCGASRRRERNDASLERTALPAVASELSVRSGDAVPLLEFALSTYSVGTNESDDASARALRSSGSWNVVELTQSI